MRSAAPLPRSVPWEPFPSRYAAQLGLSKERLRRGDLHRPARGVVSPIRPEVELLGRARTVSLVLPSVHAFSHLTALSLLGLPLPRRVRADGRLHVITVTDDPQVRRDDCIGHRGLESRSVVRAQGLRVVGPADTWCDLGELVRPLGLGVADFVAIGDAIVNDAVQRELTRRAEEASGIPWEEHAAYVRDLTAAAAGRTIGDLRQTLLRRNRPRGKRLLAPALILIRPGARSPMESRTRAMLVLEGLPEPEINVNICAPDGSGLTGEGDLVWREAKVVVEYQGEHHGGRRQHSLDEAKRRLLEEDGWVVIPMWAEDLTEPNRWSAVVRRLRRHLT